MKIVSEGVKKLVLHIINGNSGNDELGSPLRLGSDARSCLPLPPVLPPLTAAGSFMRPLRGGGNARKAHFSPAGVDRSTPPNEKGKGVIVKHVSLPCQNTTPAQ